MTHFCDRSGVVAGTSKRETDGALLADVRIARTGVQSYLGSEVDPDGSHGFGGRDVVKIYRPGSEVFSKDTMVSAAHRPVTNDHPPSNTINADNWRKHAVGNTADEVSAEGIYLRVPLIVSDAGAIADIESGKREISSGYTSELDWTAGDTPSGQHYDAVQREIRINHVAIVRRGRAGSEVRIGDAAWGAAPVNGDEEGDADMADKPMKTITVDGLTIETTDQGAQVIEKLQGQIRTLTDSSAKVLSDHATALADKDKELAKRDAEIAELKKKVVDSATMDKMVTERADLVGRVRMVAKDAKVDGLEPAAMRLAAVTSVLGADAVKDKTPAYIDARFDILLEEAVKKAGGKDKFAAAVKDGALAVADTGTAEPNKAYEAMVADLQGAHKPQKAA